MSNFIETFKQGKLGKNFGLSTGNTKLDKAINGIQRKMTIGIAAGPKVGKTTFADYATVLGPYLHIEALEKERVSKLTSDAIVNEQNAWLDYNAKVALEKDVDKKLTMRLNVEKLVDSMWKNIEWVYFSYEIDRINKEFKFAAFFMAYDYSIYSFIYKGVVYLMNQDYLMGRMQHTNEDDTTELIPVTKEHEDLLKQVYLNRIIPIFGEYAADGTMIRPGKVIFIEEPENPTGLNKYLLHYADKHGKFNTEKYYVQEEGKKVEKQRIVSYKPNNPDKFTIILTDHVRKLRRERGFTLKENIDKWLEYSTFLRNTCSFTFVHICHSNRGLANVDRLRFAGEMIFPTGDDVKDSGNLSEECTVLLTMFNPNDEKYNLEKHFGVELKDYPNYRSVHLVESRYTECPAHIQLNMIGGINMFTPLNGY